MKKKINLIILSYCTVLAFIVASLIMCIPITSHASEITSSEPPLLLLEKSKVRELNPADFKFLKKILPYGEASKINEAYEVDIGLQKKNLLILEYGFGTATHKEKSFAGFIKEEEGYRCILFGARKYLENNYRDKMVTRSRFYLDDMDGDGTQEILEFELDDNSELLRKVWGYSESSGFFTYSMTDRISGTKDPHGVKDRQLAPLTLAEYKGIRKKGTIRSFASGNDIQRWSLAGLVIDPSGTIERLPPNAIRLKNELWDITKYYQARYIGWNLLEYLRVTYDRRDDTVNGRNRYEMQVRVLKPGLYEFKFDRRAGDGRVEDIRHIEIVFEKNEGEKESRVEVSPEDASWSHYIKGERELNRKFPRHLKVGDIVSLVWSESKHLRGENSDRWSLDRFQFYEEPSELLIHKDNLGAVVDSRTRTFKGIIGDE